MQIIPYLILYPFIWIISILPFRLLYVVSDILCFFIYRVFGYRKKVVKSNLKLVFPEKSDQELSKIMVKFYHHLCDMILESFKSLTISEQEIKKRFKIKNVDTLLELGQKNKSIILMCGHYGSWEWIFILQKYINHKGYAIYKKLANKYFDRLVKRIRAKYDSHLITTKETYKVLTETQERNELTINGFAADQSPKYWKALHWGKFMGITVPMYTGAETIAKSLDMAVVFLKVKRIKRGYYLASFETITENPNQYDDFKITDLFFRLVEKQIKEAPEYYLWTHKRWKHQDKVPSEFQ